MALPFDGIRIWPHGAGAPSPRFDSEMRQILERLHQRHARRLANRDHARASRARKAAAASTPEQSRPDSINAMRIFAEVGHPDSHSGDVLNRPLTAPSAKPHADKGVSETAQAPACGNASAAEASPMSEASVA